MQVSVEVLSELERKLKVLVPQPELKQEYDQRIQRMSKEVKLKGYRPGKVPVRVIEQRYSQGVWQEVTTAKMQHSLVEALKQEELRPAVSPTIKELKADFNQDLEFSAEMEILPTLTLTPFEGVELELVSAEMDDAAIDEAIGKLQRQQVEWEEVDRAAMEKDQVRINFEGFDSEGKAIEGGAGKEENLILGEKLMPDSFEQALIGVKAGEEKDITVTYPQDFHNKKIAGKEVLFKTSVLKVSQAKLPEVDDAFATKLGVEGGVESLRDKVREGLQINLDRAIKLLNKQIITDTVFARNSDINLPKSLLAAEIDSLKKNPQQSEDKLEEIARKRVALGLLIGEYSKHYDIKTDPARVRELVSEMARQHPKPQEVVDWYYGDRQRLSSVEWMSLEEQLVDKLESVVNPKTITMSYDELLKKAYQAK